MSDADAEVFCFNTSLWLRPAEETLETSTSSSVVNGTGFTAQDTGLSSCVSCNCGTNVEQMQEKALKTCAPTVHTNMT